ncbi:flagellar basal body rod protein FlgB [Lichenicoccus sp.]|uniref:flagellar basal body rod protein FlgB n=1 Tax=Lichenicoccus sp. TaxID=2781899 RepID=UPI003D0D18EF
MDAASTDIFGLAQSKLTWLQDRQGVLARNIANADTPNYQPRDEQPFSATLSAMTVAPVLTNPMDIAGSEPTAGTILEQSDSRAPDGNAVSVEKEMTLVADTDNQQRLVTNLYGKYMSMFETALGKG